MKEIYYEISDWSGEIIDRIKSRDSQKDNLKIIQEILDAHFDTEVTILELDFEKITRYESNKKEISYRDIEGELIQDHFFIEIFSVI